ncbi:hypothetical protein CcCBS67573_g06641 [Chytriomyces confervae]|uniref:Trichohyalin-plectin-homology domain-containing protein n=1 Tax=Chytriomyces confervae TaxID=246404 RepID=A0A507F3C3_9FUNG|nr:hypothetical protein CcCBS67573_g06641 [Chytriomyces confervae]
MSLFLPIGPHDSIKRAHYGTDLSALQPHGCTNKKNSLSTIPRQPQQQQQQGWERVSANDLDTAKLLSDTTSDPTRQRREFEMEKRRLHQDSVEKSKIWPGTILGERIRTLKRKDEKEQQLEAEKLRIDAEWHDIVAQERAEKIRRAREAQRLAAIPEMRLLNSQLSLANILEQLDALIQANSVDGRSIVARAKQEHVMEIVKQELARREARKVAQTYPAVIQEKRNKKKMEKEEDRKIQQRVIEKAKLELKIEADTLEAKRQAGFREVQDAYTRALQDKMTKAIEKKAHDAEVEFEHALYQQATHDCSEKLKNVAVMKSKAKERAYDVVKEKVHELEIVTDFRIRDAVEKMQNAHKGRLEQREIRDAERRIQLDTEVAKGRALQVAERKREREILKAEGQQVRKALDLDFQEFVQTNETDKRKDIEKLRQHHKGLAEQMKRNAAARMLEDAEAKALDKKLLSNVDMERDMFVQEATAAVEEFRGQGKNIVPALHTISPRRPFPAVQFETNYNTYARLGFCDEK